MVLTKIGESRQVDGNLRAVIVDEAGTRVKDVTLKEVQINPGTMEALRSITNQLQMRQIYAKHDTITCGFGIQRYQSKAKVPLLFCPICILWSEISNPSQIFNHIWDSPNKRNQA